MPDYDSLLQYIQKLEISERVPSRESSNKSNPVINEQPKNEQPLPIVNIIFEKPKKEEGKNALVNPESEEQIKKYRRLQQQLYQLLDIGHLEDSQMVGKINEKMKDNDQQSKQ